MGNNVMLSGVEQTGRRVSDNYAGYTAGVALSLVPRAVFDSVEPAVRSLANRLFILTGGRAGSIRHKPTIASFYETGIVLAVYEFLLMDPALAHLEIRREMPYPARTRPEQVDLWIRPPSGGYPHLIEAGDFTPGKLKDDAKKMRRLNRNGARWFLGFFRRHPDSSDPWAKLIECRGRKGSLKGVHIRLDKRLARSFTIQLPGQQQVQFGFALVRVK